MHNQSTTVTAEEWRPVVGFEALYSVSNRGRVRSEHHSKRNYPGRILKPSMDTNGRLYVQLRRQSGQFPRRIHTLVAAAFIGPRLPDMQTNHIDGDRLHNCASNLEYLTDAEHKAHSVRMGLVARGEGRPETDLTESDIIAIRLSNDPVETLAIRYDKHVMSIRRIRRGERWKHVGGPLSPNLGKGKYVRAHNMHVV